VLSSPICWSLAASSAAVGRASFVPANLHSPAQNLPLGHDANGILAQFLRHEFHWRGFALIPMNKQVHTATRPAGGDALQAFDGHLAEVGGEVRDDQELIFLRQPACLCVVFRERSYSLCDTFA
jgi:hypothetical protein